MSDPADIPLFEYDPSPSALIEPTALISPRDDMPRACVLTWFRDAVERAVADTFGRRILQLQWEDGPRPVYEIEHEGRPVALAPMPVGGAPSAAALEDWIAAHVPGGRVAGIIGFSQGAMVALQLLRRNAQALDWVVQLSGAPFPTEMPGDAALADRRPPAFWGHGGMDPHFADGREEAVRDFLSAHTRLEEERRPQLGHSVDEIELRAVASFLQRRAADARA